MHAKRPVMTRKSNPCGKAESELGVLRVSTKSMADGSLLLTGFSLPVTGYRLRGVLFELLSCKLFCGVRE